MKEFKNVIFHAFVTIVALVVVSVVLISTLSKRDYEKKLVDEKKNLAVMLFRNKLYEPAIVELKDILDNPYLRKQDKANVSYTIASAYFENLNDYPNALSYYQRVEYYDPSSKLIKQTKARIVECLERMNRSLEAQTALETATDLKEEKRDFSGEVMAKIGDREIKMGELDYQIEKMPPYIQQQFKDKKSKLDFLRTYVGRDLLYNAAKRKGLDSDKDIIEKAFQAKKDVMVQKYYQDEIEGKIKVNDSDLELYYKANLDKYKEPRKLKVAHILFDDEKKAKEILETLKKTPDKFGEFVKKESKDTATKDKNGEIGYVKEDGVIPYIGQEPEINKELFKFKQGELSGVIKSKKGFHIFKILEDVPERTRTFDEVKNMVKSSRESELRANEERQLIDRLMKAENVIIYEDKFAEPEKEKPEEKGKETEKKQQIEKEAQPQV